MNQKELIDAVAGHHSNTGVSKTTIKWVLEAIAEVAHKELRAGGEIVIPGIGKLTVKHRAGRDGRNPATGETLKIEAKNVPAFTAAKALKDAVA